MPESEPNPSEFQVEILRFRRCGGIPNNQELPVLIYRNALPSCTGGNFLEATGVIFRKNGWLGIWRGTVLPYQHYHPDAHEVLACHAGSARLRLGGEQGQEIIIKAGDGLVLPAGTGHRRISGTPGFGVVGAYPPGQQNYSLYEDNPSLLDEARERIALLNLPRKDPFFGEEGPVIDYWRQPAAPAEV